jgi:hypothetical protein
MCCGWRYRYHPTQGPPWLRTPLLAVPGVPFRHGQGTPPRPPPRPRGRPRPSRGVPTDSWGPGGVLTTPATPFSNYTSHKGGTSLRDLEQIDKSPSKCSQTRDPKTRDQIPKRPRRTQCSSSNTYTDSSFSPSPFTLGTSSPNPFTPCTSSPSPIALCTSSPYHQNHEDIGCLTCYRL